ncbi:hypothetical protein DMN91_000136 [Ooceraea biroi]|uniref:HMG box domain-containing protein n=1 Tax=Ooceraea biroi TaxID=2015173 RepID=A0A026W512_OOCBI|nr:hypothetical protein X777_10756 [Ooceraea biroi]RLU26342.1 hypothetical protein DMN91_000136 [Ooceraea biroi]
MGNSNSAGHSKTQIDRKKEVPGSADTGKGRRSASGNGKTASQNSRDLDRRDVHSRATNPFIIFFLRLRSKKPNEHVTVIARVAGKLWSRMTPEQRKKYVDLANAEKKRRQERKRKRKRLSVRSR